MYKSPKCSLPSFKSNGLLFQEKKQKLDFQNGGHGRHLGFPIGTSLAIFDLQVTQMLPTKFRVNLPFRSEEEKNRFLRWRPWRPSWIAERKDFSCFALQDSLMLPTSFKSAIRFRRRSELDFQDSCHGSHLGFPIEKILAIFDLQVTPMLPTKFQVNWPVGSGEDAKNRFSRWPPLQPSGNFDRNDFSFF